MIIIFSVFLSLLDICPSYSIFFATPYPVKESLFCLENEGEKKTTDN